MKQFNFYASACGSGHGNWMIPIGGSPVNKLSDADVVIFGGGADVSPQTYNEKPASSTSDHPSRERQEKLDFIEARKLGKKLVGICRG